MTANATVGSAASSASEATTIHDRGRKSTRLSIGRGRGVSATAEG